MMIHLPSFRIPCRLNLDAPSLPLKIDVPYGCFLRSNLYLKCLTFFSFSGRIECVRLIKLTVPAFKFIDDEAALTCRLETIEDLNFSFHIQTKVLYL